MTTKRLDTLLRKNKGKALLYSYTGMFRSAGFQNDELTHIELEKADELIIRIREVFPNLNREVEFLPGEGNYQDSKLLMLILSNFCDGDCYVYSDDVYFCGMYQTTVKSAIEYCLKVAKFGYSNTCFILDRDFKYSFRINYYVDGEPSLRSKFDIQLKRV